MNLNFRRIKKLTDFLRKLPRDQFRFAELRIEHACGTIGCGIGHLPTVFPRLCESSPNSEPARNGRLKKAVYCGVFLKGYPHGDYDTFAVASEILGIPEPDVRRLFMPGYTIFGQYLGERATPAQLADRLDQYAAWRRVYPGTELLWVLASPGWALRHP